MKWFRWYRGTTENPKFKLAARNGGVTLITVIGVWSALLEDAAHEDHRGICEKQEDFIAAALDIPDDGTVEKVLHGLESVGLISVGHGAITICRWQKFQYEQDIGDPTNTERQKRFRDRKRMENSAVTDRNATVTERNAPDTDTDTDTETDTEKKDCANAPLDPAVPEREYFLRGREVLGKGAGGLIGKLLKAKGGNVALARAALEHASQKENPTEYVAAICRGPPVSAKPLTEHQRKQAEAREILDEIGSAICGGSSQGGFGTLRHDPGGRPESVRGGVGGNLIALPATGHRSGR